MNYKLEKLLKSSESGYVILDGGMGTMLQACGMPPGELPELLCLTDPGMIEGIHTKYIKAGADVIYADTFGANAHKLEGCGHSVSEVVSAAIAVAKQSAAKAGRSVMCALDIGPLGELLEPYGMLSFEGAYDMFAEIVRAGALADADLIVIETMTDLYEVKAAVLAAKENSDLPVFVTMSFEKSGRTFTGTTVESMACLLEGLGVDAVGINCSLGPDEILPIARRLDAATSLPIIIKPNAGMPDPEDGSYNVSSDDFAQSLKNYLDLGVVFAGGCCGTSPEYINALKSMLSRNAHDRSREPHRKLTSRICTPMNTVTIDSVKVIGERINPTGKKRFKQALQENDIDYILHQGIEQMEAGADILDVNVGLPGIDEPAMMRRVVRELQAVVDIPLQIDSSDPKAIEAGLRICNGKPIVNSVNGKEETMKTIFPLVKKYGAAVLGLTLDENGIPSKAEDRFAIAEKIVNTAMSYGIRREDVFIDCLTLTVSAQQAEAAETLKAVRMVRERLGVHAVLGVSNISFGLPYRELLNATFLTLAIANGLDLPIMNPNNQAMMNSVRAARVLYNNDKNCDAYIEKYAGYTPPSGSGESGGKTQPEGPGPNAAPDPAGPALSGREAAEQLIRHAIGHGLKEESLRAVNELLKYKSEMEAIDQDLIPALDDVGNRFEKGIIFLPQLLNAAAAASEAFEVIKKRIAASGEASVSKGKIILATVKGDIHDIGKNIVKILLENYGYTVIDLGRNVDPELIVKTAVSEDVHLVGLSALMTTTLVSMEETIKALRASGHDCKIMVGGSVLTADYAEKIGADYYADDAKESSEIAKKVLN